jgi:hypothetical protein
VLFDQVQSHQVPKNIIGSKSMRFQHNKEEKVYILNRKQLIKYLTSNFIQTSVKETKKKKHHSIKASTTDIGRVKNIYFSA